jgi:hypothetical protein
MKWLFLIFVIFAASTSFVVWGEDAVYAIRTWEVSVDSAVKDYCSGSESARVNIFSLKEYDNRIYNHILSINPDIRNRIQLLRSARKPSRDLLFIDGKLFVIMERQDSIDDPAFKTVFVKMKNIYGIPEMKKEKELTIYTFKNEKTNAILIVRPSENGNDIKIYLYSQSLFRMLFRD